LQQKDELGSTDHKQVIEARKTRQVQDAATNRIRVVGNDASCPKMQDAMW